ncbi:MAG: LysM peptidoglycan-binding domain-containing protein [Eubacterium sp.]|nr:LysM peptidoglycan-binding domain-containing protein [Eubacterium sp.]
MKLKYKNFEFPSNPGKIEIMSSSNCNSKPIFDGNSAVENVSVNPVIVTGSGEFFGEGREEYCGVLQNLLKSTESGWLFLPSAPPVKAYFTEFKFSQNTKRNSISYTFEFTEDCTDRKSERLFKYTVAGDGENAFEIANRCSVSVNDIMRLNDLKSPFEISKGDRVVLR